MGGVDLLDRLCSSYRPMIRGKKWYWPLFLNIINASIVAAWKVYCIAHVASQDKLDHLDFRREITLSLLKLENMPRAVGASLPANARYDSMNQKYK